uniref:Uncharacterized protein n=1 Tax=Arundo donax TaxID=35708 RepID=A0A0A9SF99_ARUDO
MIMECVEFQLFGTSRTKPAFEGRSDLWEISLKAWIRLGDESTCLINSRIISIAS